MAWWNEIEMRIVQRQLVLALFGAYTAYIQTTLDNSLYEQINQAEGRLRLPWLCIKEYKSDETTEVRRTTQYKATIIEI